MKYIFFLLFLSNINFALANCLVPDSSIEPEIEVAISKEGEVYIYNYTVKNPSKNKLPIPLFNIETGVEPLEVVAPEGWREMKSARPQTPYMVKWADLSGKKLTPGSMQKGFIIKSKNPPGIVQIKIKGKNLKPYVTNEISKVNEKTICPGIWLAGSTAEKDNYVSTFTEGPVPSNTISVPMKIKLSGDKVWKGGMKEEGKGVLISSHDNKLVELIIESSPTFDVETLDFDSLKVGRGLIKPISIKIISDFGDGINNSNSSKTFVKNLYLTFKSTEAEILCDVDQSLFVSGITKEEKKFLAATKIERTPCTVENWSNEAAKIKARNSDFYK